MEKEPNRRWNRWSHIGQVMLGILLLGGVHAGLFVLMGLWPNALIAVLFIGIFQWIYALPAVIMLKRAGQVGMMQGVLIGAGLTFLLNAACFGLLLSGPLY